MSSCFYNSNGDMVGLDYHDYTGAGPPIPFPPYFVPVPGKAFYLVIGSFDDTCDKEDARLKKVTSDGHPMIQRDFKLVNVTPHLPLIPIPLLLPHPIFEPALMGVIIYFSGSTALLAVASVTGVGTPLACCIGGAWGTNLNCGDPIDLPSDVVHNSSSVLTQPTGADFARAVLDFAISGLISKLVGDGFDALIEKYATQLVKILLKTILFPLRKKVEDIIKNIAEDVAKYLKDPIKNLPRSKSVLQSLGVTHV